MNSSSAKANRWRIEANQLETHYYQNHLHQPLTKDLGEGYSNICQLDDDLSYIETEYTPSKNLALISKIDSQEPRLVVTLALKGQSRFACQGGTDIIFKQGYTSITAFNTSLGERQFEADKNILQLRFAMNKNWLEKHFGEYKTNRLFKNKNIQTISHTPITSQGMVIAQQLRSDNTDKDLKKLFIHGQAITLLSSELAPLFASNDSTTNKFTKKDKQIANAARDILLNAFKNPPSVEQLSKQVGCNQFKLKQLFHHYFNNTPYGILLEIRMNKAYQLLQSSHCHVNIAADFVGYKHASSFSTAFVKFFGVTPKTISK